MKRILLFLTIFYFALLPHNSLTILASSRYARIETTTQIYRSTSGSKNIDNIYCLAEQSYFVEIISDYKEYYRVNYNGINGYVKKNDVKEISNIPSTPYPYNIKIIIGSTCNLRSSPTTKTSSNNVISVLYNKTSDITFIGRAVGEEAIDFGGNTWYYVCYQGNYGYIYNNYIQSISPIYASTEDFSYIKPSIDKIENPITHTPSLIIIVILSLPLFAILFLLYLPKKHKNISKPQKTKKTIEKY